MITIIYKSNNLKKSRRTTIASVPAIEYSNMTLQPIEGNKKASPSRGDAIKILERMMLVLCLRMVRTANVEPEFVAIISISAFITATQQRSLMLEIQHFHFRSFIFFLIHLDSPS